jgi:aspartate aminotransferase
MSIEKLAARLSKISESQTLAMARKSRELQAQGKDVISLSIGEPDYDTPDFIKEAAKKAIDQNYTHYTPVAGFQDLRVAIADKFKRDNQITYTPEQIVVSTGAKQSIANVILSLVDEGDEVIVPIPYWVSYIELIKLADGIPVYIYAGVNQNFKISAQQLEAAITPKTRMIIFSTPCNPSGSVYNKQELEALVKVLEKYPNIYIVSDEIYEHINFVGKHESMAQFPSVYNNTVSTGFVRARAWAIRSPSSSRLGACWTVNLSSAARRTRGLSEKSHRLRAVFETAISASLWPGNRLSISRRTSCFANSSRGCPPGLSNAAMLAEQSINTGRYCA